MTFTDLGETAGSLGVAVTVTIEGPNVEPENRTLNDKANPGPKVTVEGDTLTDTSLDVNATLIIDDGATERPKLTTDCDPAPDRSRFNDPGLELNVTANSPPEVVANGFFRK